MKPSTLRIWGWPVTLGVLTTTGLLSALVSDTWGDAWSWFALGVPVAVRAWYGLRRPRAGADRPATAAAAME